MQSGFVSNSGLDVVLTAAAYLVLVSLALIIREFFRARVGEAVGDRVPRLAGRLKPSFRNMYDPLGSIFFPMFAAVTGATAYSWATPLSYDIGNPGSRRPVVVSSVAGSLANLTAALLAARLVSPLIESALATRVLVLFVVANVSMAVMHMLPVPPLDGSRIVAAFLSPQARAAYQRIEPWGIAILFGIAFVFRALFSNQPFDSIISALLRLIA